MPTVLDENTADLVLDTPMTIYTSASNKHYSGWINFDEMDTGDITVLTINVKVLTGDSFSEFFKKTFADINGGLDSPVFLIPFIPGSYGVEFILEQTDGTVRDYKWQIVEP